MASQEWRVIVEWNTVEAADRLLDEWLTHHGLSRQDIDADLRQEISRSIDGIRTIRYSVRRTAKRVLSPDDLRLTEPWYAIEGEQERTAMEEQLRRELLPGHELHGQQFWAIARRQDRDYVLVALAEGWAIVHLAWTPGPADDPRSPRSQMFATTSELQERLDADVREFDP
jgi:hypothetical protein